MTFFNKLCAGSNPQLPPALKDVTTGEAVPWVNSWTDQHLATMIPDDNRRSQLLTLMGPLGCKFCTQLLKDQGSSKLLFPHLVFKNNIKNNSSQANILGNYWRKQAKVKKLANLACFLKIASLLAV